MFTLKIAVTITCQFISRPSNCKTIEINLQMKAYLSSFFISDYANLH